MLLFLDVNCQVMKVNWKQAIFPKVILVFSNFVSDSSFLISSDENNFENDDEKKYVAWIYFYIILFFGINVTPVFPAFFSSNTLF